MTEKLLTGSPSMVDRRTAVVVIVMFCGMARWEEVATLELSQVQLLTSGNISLLSRKSKTNQTAKEKEIIIPEGDSRFCPVRVLVDYMDLLRTMSPDNKWFLPGLKSVKSGEERRLVTLATSCSYDSIRTKVKEVLQVLEIQVEGGTPFGLHSCRRGAATAAAASGQFTVMELMMAGRWADANSAVKYVEESEGKKASVGKLLVQQVSKELWRTGPAGKCCRQSHKIILCETSFQFIFV